MAIAQPDAPLQKRIDILAQAVASGKQLKPEHKAEYDNYVKMGLAHPVGAKPITPAQASDYQAVLGTIDKSLDDAGWWETGMVGSTIGKIPGTPAYDFHRNLETIKANLAFDRLQQMRDNSPTGGAVGQVSDNEQRMLMSAVASLDPGQSEEQLKANLGTVKKHYQNYLKSLGYDTTQTDVPKVKSGTLKKAADGVYEWHP